jgi:hypothetical protein
VIAEAIPAAPAIPVLEITGALLLLAFAWVVLWGMKYGYDYSFGALLRKLADVLDVKVWKISIGGGFAFRAVDDFVQARIADGIDEVELAMAKTFHGLELLVRMIGDTAVGFAGDVQSALDGLVHGEIPKAVAGATRPLAVDLGKIRTWLRAETARLESTLTRKAHALELELDRDFGRAWRGIDAINSKTLPRLYHEILGDIAAVRGYTLRHLRLLRARVRALELELATGALAAIAITALTRVWPYWKCTNVRRAMRGICRAPTGLIDLLFGLGVETIVVSQLCDFIAAVSSAARFVEPELLAFVAVEDVLIGCHGATKPLRWRGHTAALPPRQALASLPSTGS